MQMVKTGLGKIPKMFPKLERNLNFAVISVMSGLGICYATGEVETTADAIVGEVVGIVCSIFRYVGILLLCYGIGQLVMAFKNDDADSKSRAMQVIIVSIVLIVIKTFVSVVLSAAGVSIDIS